MKARPTIRLITVLAMLVSAGCGLGKSDPGSFEIVFDWLDPEPENNAGLWVWGRVERREGGAAQGTQMAESALAAFSPGVQLPFSDVPYSENLVVIVEIKEGQSKTARAKYFGESDVFALEPGKHVKVTVKLKLTKTPDAPDGALLIVETTEKGYVKSALVTLSVEASRATKVMAANDMGFSVGEAEKSLSDLRKDGARHLWSGWDLNSGICGEQASGLGLQTSDLRQQAVARETGRAPGSHGRKPVDRVQNNIQSPGGAAQPACRDGLRTVYVKFVNDPGYESEVFSAQVTLDTTAPALAGGSVTPAHANGSSRVTVVVNPVEPLSADPVLQVAPSDPGFSAAQKVGESYVYTYDVNEGAVEGTAYAFSVDLIDLAGNETKGAVIEGTVTVDRTPPAVSEGSVDKTRVGVGGTVTVTFEVDEELPEDPVVTIGDKTMSPVVGDQWSVVRRGATQAAPPAPTSAPGDLARGTGHAPGSHGREPVVEGQNNNQSPGGAAHAHLVLGDCVAPTALGAFVEFPIHGFTPVATSVPPPAGGYTFTYNTDGTEPEGTFLITIQAVDLAGNRRSESLPDRVTFDFSPPQVVSSVASPSLAALGGEVVFQATMDEPLAPGSAPKLVTTPAALSWTDAEAEGSSYRWKHTAQPGESGTYAVAIDQLCDDLGNCADNVPLPTGVALDVDAPALSGPPEIQPAGGNVKSGVEVRVNLNVVENATLAGGYPTVKLGGVPMLKQAQADAGWGYTFAYTPAKGTDSEGLKTIVIELADTAGNAKTDSAGTVDLDFTEPVLTMTINPPSRAARLGEVLTVNVTSNEALDGTGVLLDKGGMALGDPSVSGTSYAWTYAVKDTDAATFNLSATATDLAGNAAAQVAKSITVDGVVPTVSGATVNPPKVKGGEQFTLTFTASEDLNTDPVATFSNGVDAAVSMSKTGQTVREYTYSGTAPASGSAQVYTVTVGVTDPAGNSSTSNVGTMEIDNVAPTLAGLEVAPAGAKVGDTLRAVLSADEALSGPPALSAKSGGATITFAPVDSTPKKISYTYTYPVTQASPQGVFAVEPFVLSDIAGNIGNVTPSKTFTVDSTVPALDSGPTLNKDPASYKAGDTVSVTFTTSEDLDAVLPTVVLNTDPPKPMPCVAGAGTNDYACALAQPLQGTETPEGQAGISIQLQDAAGNTGFGQATATLDFTLPSLTDSGATPDPAGLGKTLRYTVNVSEPLAGTPGRPTVKVLKGGVEQPGFFGDPATETNTSFTYVKPVAPGYDGIYTVKIGLTDVSGNEAPGINASGFEIDATAPGFTAYDVSPSKVKAAQDVTVTFTTSESLADDPVLQLGPLPMTKTGQTGKDYTYKYTTTGAEGDGMRTVSVQLSDAAGNQGSEVFSETVEFDFSAPQVANSAASPNPAKLGSVIQYQVTTSEALSNTPALATIPALTWIGPSQSGLTYTWTHTATSGETNTYTAKLDQLCDIVSNCISDVTAGMSGFSVDAAAPTVTAHNVVPLLVKSGQDVTVTLTASELLPSDPLVQLGSLAMAKTGQIGQDYTYKYTTLGTEGDGTRNVTVQMTDVAGNVGGAAFAETVRFDFTNPTVTTSTASPNPAKLGAVITYSVTVSEAITNTPALTTTPALTWTGPSQSGLTYTWTHTAATGETATYTAELDQLCDQAANCVSNVTANMAGFQIDALTPSATAHTVSPLLVKSGQDVTVTLTASEPLANDPLVQLGSLSMTMTGQTGQDHTFKYTTQGTEGDGTRNVTVQMTDIAGNVGGAAFTETIRFDFTNPTVTTSTASPNPAKLGAVITYSATVSEAITNTPALTTTPALTWTGPSQNGLTYTWTHTAVSGETATYTAELDQLCDQAANCVSNVTAGMAGFQIDALAPSVTTHTVGPLLVKSGQDVAVTLTASEPLASDPLVQLGSLQMAKTGQMGQDYTYEYSTTGAEGDGTRNVTVQMTDIGGNVGGDAFAETVRFDFTNPSVTTSTASPSPAKLGAVIMYNVTVSETITSTPALTTTPALAWTGPSQNGLTYTWAHTAAPGETNTYTAKLDQLCDQATNCVNNVTAGMAGFQIDSLPPAVTLLSPAAGTKYSRQIGYNTLTATFDTENLDAVPGGLAVTAGGRTVPCGAYNSAGSPRYTCSRTMDGADTEGATSVTIETRDAAGNQASASVGVVFDFTAPFVVVGSASVQFTPDYPTTNPLPYVTAATNNTKVRTTFTLSEPASPSPKVIMYKTAAFDEAQSIELTLQVQAGTLYTYEGTVSGVATGLEFTDKIQIPLTPQIADAVGNTPTAILDVTTFPLDTNAPAAPDVATADKIIYKRVPWGSDATAGAKTFTLRGAAGALPADATKVVVYDNPNPGPGSLIGLAEKRPDNGFDEFALNGADRAHVYATTSDTAGNLSSANEVKDAEWIATMGYKVPGSKFENSNDFLISAEFRPTRTQDLGGVTDPLLADLLKLERADGEALIGLAEGSWQELVPSSSKPSARSRQALAYDGALGKMIMFGGDSAGTMLQDIWEWDGTLGVWNNRTPSITKPSARADTAATYDTKRGKTILFGGYGGSKRQDTWEWDGAFGTWAERTPSGAKPSARSGHALAYESSRGKAILFGGSDGSMLQDTWEWDGETGTWTDRTPIGDKPSARYDIAMAYDGLRRKVVLFGGWKGQVPIEYFQDTWEWDGALGTWIERTPLLDKPSARSRYALTYDAVRGKVVLFGGYNGTTSLQDTWEWDGEAGTWTDRTTTGTKPPASSPVKMVFDTSRGKVVLSVGMGASQATWEWDGVLGTWTERVPAGTRPTPRYGHAMAYDAEWSKLVLFGGLDGVQRQDTWEWDGALETWTARTPGGANPSARYRHAMAYDATRKKVVLFGGYDGFQRQDTWEWDGASRTWTDRTPAFGNPPVRSRHSMAYDESRGKVVLFGGYNGSGYMQDTWEWDGDLVTWTERTPSVSPSARSGHSITWDASRRMAVLSGGFFYDGSNHYFNDIWEWDGTLGTWTDRTTVGTKPSVRYDHSLVYDAARDKVLLFGGQCSASGPSCYRGDTWEWDGPTGIWTERVLIGIKPSERYQHAVAYDTARRRVVLFGGADGSYRQDTWEWDGGSTLHAGQVIQTPFDTAGVTSTPTLKSVTGTFYSGAIGYPSGVATNGVDLKVWDEGMWKVVATNNAAPDNPQLVSWTTTDPQVISRLFFGDQQTLNFAVTPVAPNGTGTGEVSVDYVEVVVKYRQP